MNASRLPFATYPVVLAVALVTQLVAASGVSPFAAARSVVVTLGITLALAALGSRVIGRDRAGVGSILTIVVVIAADARVTAAALLAFGLVFAAGRLSRERVGTIRWPRVSLVLSRLTAIYALAVLIQAIQIGTPEVIMRALQRESDLRPDITAAALPTDPDIYLMLLDGHARADVMTDTFGTDGRQLVDALEARGFDVAAKSRSNYAITAPTLISMLNMAQLPDMPRVAGLLAGTESPRVGQIVRDAINDNEVFRVLRGRGYWIAAISSGFEEVSVREADLFVDTGQLNEVEVGILRQTMLADLLRFVAPDAASAQQRDRIRNTFDASLVIADQADARPLFLFTHVPSPHAPWVFRADGSPRTVDDLEAFYADTPISTGLTDTELRRAYAEQVLDIDRRLLKTLDGLEARIAERSRPAVIVVFSDHGTGVGVSGDNFPTRFKNLLAVKRTGRALVLEENQTLVNLFPNLFEQLFGIPWVRRADTTYRFGDRDSFQLTPLDDPDAAIGE